MNETLKLYSLVTYLEGNHTDIYSVGVAPELYNIIYERYRNHPITIVQDKIYVRVKFEHKNISYEMKYYHKHDWMLDTYALFINGTKTLLSLEDVFNGTNSTE